METIKKTFAELLGNRPVVFITSGVVCFTAGWLSSYWSRRWFNSPRILDDSDSTFGVGSQVDGNLFQTSDSRGEFRSYLTCAERRLAKEAANELISVLRRYRQNVYECDGQGVCYTGGETGAGVGERHLHVCEHDQGVYDSGSDDNTF
uniref:Protein m38.5 n=1 Tax=Mastomys natalensis cytomegalovirus 2 TaxID=2973540 RepID=A0A9Y1IMK2_9BETA|nr:protein m38.5 [Mastomys natalensis cytomegalovirus 2]WEG69180.1 protein m38.5 [Mastomys natalensis cytomegalovirus 2]WEG69319.1 protein m38.5 [Mastomys natalensis cytomegalovirus 2]WEG69457.1 protein m38.5 [Mastomys natalensis cytomegalovirus 2]WEG69595.1 protein m38.5 [Mastomys natalensis cytomegalovirus 2]